MVSHWFSHFSRIGLDMVPNFSVIKHRLINLLEPGSFFCNIAWEYQPVWTRQEDSVNQCIWILRRGFSQRVGLLPVSFPFLLCLPYTFSTSEPNSWAQAEPNSHLCCISAVWPWASYFALLCFGSWMYKLPVLGTEWALTGWQRFISDDIRSWGHNPLAH